MDNLPEDIERHILSYLKVCKNNKYHLVSKNWYNKNQFQKCEFVNIFNRNICIYHNPEIKKMFGVLAMSLY